ncbi:hypothetical protein LCGC14_1390890 [marine sediment metagenome]|uniref:Uncharacterized protein n=1 Tax=marine sediment metagenome TaxID=412755 RepID=A0A0F9N1K8_9ZZZZ
MGGGDDAEEVRVEHRGYFVFDFEITHSIILSVKCGQRWLA